MRQGIINRHFWHRPQENPVAGGLPYAAVDRVLALYTAGLSGGRLELRASAPGEPAFTDTRHVYLPPYLGEFPTVSDNFQLYKLTIAHKYLQVEQGSLAVDGFFDRYTDRSLVEDLYALVENYRLEAILVKDFPGLAGFLRVARADAWAKRPSLRGLGGRVAAVEALLQLLLGGRLKSTLRIDQARAVDRCLRLVEQVQGEGQRTSLDIAAELYELLSAQNGSYSRRPPVHYLGSIRWDRIAWMLRLMREQECKPSFPMAENRGMDREMTRPRPPIVVESNRPPPAPEGRLQAGTASQIQVSFASHDSSPMGMEVELSEDDKRGAILYHEWDYRQGSYRAEWCALHERQVRPGREEYVDEVMARNYIPLTRLRRQFEALRPERRRLRRQMDGEDVDIDAAVEAYADARARLPFSEKLYLARRETRRDIAVGFLVDLSGSTGGWLRDDRRIIDVEKEALILISEALDVLGDKFGIYGFSGTTRRQCDFYRIKDFTEPVGPAVRARIAGLDTFSYTRMGVAIRHLASILSRVEAKVRLLLLLSDGRPNDYDGYGGPYGIEDTRHALLECRQMGIRTFCLTIDTAAREYLPYLFGPAHYTIIDDTALLPERLPDLYRRLTGLGS